MENPEWAVLVVEMGRLNQKADSSILPAVRKND